MNVLGIESSCDETAAAVVVDGRRILSSVVASQVKVHHPFGGVVPELAARSHIEAVVPVVEGALTQTDKDLRDIDAIAVTRGPGLVGALLVGYSFAKACAYALDIPWVGVNHLEGHLNSVSLTAHPPPFPFVALLASGGHTSLYHVTAPTVAELLGQTRDDAAGEAFDKVAKMLGLGYPGGRVIGELAVRGDRRAIGFPRAYLDRDAFDFSFSGLKTAVRQYIESHPVQRSSQRADIAAGFEEAVVDVLCYKVLAAAEARGCRHLALVGGVAANRRLRERVVAAAAGRDLEVHLPPSELCGDNAAMIAAAGFHLLQSGRRDSLDGDVYSRCRY